MGFIKNKTGLKKIMTIKMLITLGSVFFMLLACEEQSGPVVSNQPVIFYTMIESAWNISSEEKYIVEVRSSDPQGVDNLDKASLNVLDQTETVVFSSPLYDDGAEIHPQAGDVFAKDGVFRNQFKPSEITALNGEYYFRVTVEDRDGNVSDYSQDTVAFNRSSPLLLTEVWVMDSLLARDKEFFFSMTVRDTSRPDATVHAWFDLVQPDNGAVLERYKLYNDGDQDSHGDEVAGDSLFSVIKDTTFGAERSGWYELHFQAENEYKSKSNVVIRSTYIENNAGLIYNSDMPESVTRPESFVLKAWVSDPQGLTDIDSVYIMLKDSQGKFLTGSTGVITKVLLYDDGNSVVTGDEVPKDGVFSRILQVTAANQADSYTIYYYMRDKTGNLSDPWLDYLTIN